MIVQLCRLLIRKYAKGKDPLAYALRYDGGRFDPGTGCFLSESGHGLTCATFVLAVFKSHGVDLLRTDQWRERDEDKKWQQWILDELGDARYATPEHIRAVEREIKLGCARFRPQEVAAAGTAETPDALPISFEDAARLGELLVDTLLARAAR